MENNNNNNTVVLQKNVNGDIIGGGFSFVPTLQVLSGGGGDATDYFTQFAIPFGLATKTGGFRKDAYQSDKSVKVMAQELHEKLLELVQEKRVKSEKSKKNRKALFKHGKTKKNYE